MSEIGEKQFLLTGYLEYLLKKIFGDNKNENHSISNGYANGLTNGHSNGTVGTNNKRSTQPLPVVEIITPSDPKQRGSQLSISFSVPLQLVQEELEKLGIVVSNHIDVGRKWINHVKLCPVRYSNAKCDASGSGSTLQLLYRCLPFRTCRQTSVLRFEWKTTESKVINLSIVLN